MKTLAAVIAGGTLAFNAWIAGVFNSGYPVGDFSFSFFIVIYAQTAFVFYVVALSSVLAIDVAGGILGGTIIIVIADVIGAFRGAFDIEQLVSQFIIAYFTVVVVSLVTAYIKTRRRRSSKVLPPESS